MNSLVPLLAQMEAQDVVGEGHLKHSTLLQLMMIAGAMLLVVGLVFLWAIFIRKPTRRRRKHHKHHQKTAKAVSAAAEKAPANPGESGTQKKGRRSRRDHRPRNPTLAETRGLPPIREEQSTSPPPY